MRKITRRGIAAILGGFGSAIAGTRTMSPEDVERAAKIRKASRLSGIPPERVKITEWHPDTCRCKLAYVWDFATVDDPDARVHHPLSAECCPVHACHTTPAAALDAVWKENRAKNIAVGAAADLIMERLVGPRPKGGKRFAKFDEVRGVLIIGSGDEEYAQMHGGVCASIRFDLDSDRKLTLTLPEEFQHLLAEVRAVVHESVEVV